MHSRYAVCSVLLLVLLLSACGQHTGPQKALPPDESAGAVSAEPESEASTASGESAAPQRTEVPSLTQLRETIAQAGALGGVAYLGTLPEANGTALRTLLTQSRTAEQYPFLRDIPESDAVFAAGQEVYCVVPGTADTALTVSTTDGSTLYQGTAAPLLLVCNQSQVEPNTQVTLRDGAGHTTAFSPALGLCDGRLVLSTDDRIYDFSRYDQDAGQEAASAHASYLGTWQLDSTVGGQRVFCRLTFTPEGDMTYHCGYPGTDVQDTLRGTFYEIDSNARYPAGSVLFELTFPSDNSPFWGVFTLNVQGETLTVTHVGGEVLLYGSEGQSLTFQATS